MTDISQPTQTKKDKERSAQKKSVRLSFLFLGISQLMAWNTIVNSFDYFIKKQPNHNPSVEFGIRFTTTQLICQILILFLGNYIPSKAKVFIFEITALLATITIPIAPIIFPEELSYPICIGLVILVGISTAFANSIFGIIAYFPKEDCVAINVGQGYSGLGTSVLRIIVLIFLGTSDKVINKQAIIFFGFALLIITFVLIRTIFLFRNPYFIEVNEKKGAKEEEEKLVKKENEESKELADINNEENDIESTKQLDKSPETLEKKMTIGGFISHIIEVAILMILLFCATSIVFPAIMFIQEIFGLSVTWKVPLSILTFNIFDTIGRRLVSYIESNKRNLYIVALGRLLCVFIALFNFYNQKYKVVSNNLNSLITLINNALFGLTSGIGCTLAMSTGPMMVNSEWKGTAADLLVFCLNFGLVIGSRVCGVIVGMIHEKWLN